MPLEYTQNEMYLMFNHYRDIRASGKFKAEAKAALGGYMSTDLGDHLELRNRHRKFSNRRYLYK